MNLKYLLYPVFVCGVSLASCVMEAAEQQGSPSVRPSKHEAETCFEGSTRGNQ